MVIHDEVRIEPARRLLAADPEDAAPARRLRRGDAGRGQHVRRDTRAGELQQLTTAERP